MPTKKQITEKIREAYERLGKLEQVSIELYDGKIGITTLSRILSVTDDYWPKEKEICDILQPPQPKPDYRLRPVHVLCYGEEHEKFLALSTRERAIRLLGENND